MAGGIFKFNLRSQSSPDTHANVHGWVRGTSTVLDGECISSSAIRLSLLLQLSREAWDRSKTQATKWICSAKEVLVLLLNARNTSCASDTNPQKRDRDDKMKDNPWRGSNSVSGLASKMSTLCYSYYYLSIEQPRPTDLKTSHLAPRSKRGAEYFLPV